MSNITVLTPAYNRGKLLEKLYESLCVQDCKDFEWLIVDDGSTDDTSERVEQMKQTADFPISYHKKENGGKHTALNYIIGKPCNMVLDPTMLLNKSEWDKIAKVSTRIKRKKYLLTYFLGGKSDEINKKISEYARRYECDVINMLDIVW